MKGTVKFLFLTIVVINLAVLLASCNRNSNNTLDWPDDNSSRNGVSIFGYDVDDSRFFTQHVSSKLGWELTKGTWSEDNTWRPMTYFTVGGEQFVMGHNAKSNNGHSWFIQKILPTGDIGAVTDSGTWNNYYDTLIGLEAGGRTFIFGQSKKADNRWFVQEILSGGKLADHEADSGTWEHFFGAITPVYVKDRTCFYAQSETKNYWCVECLHDDGKLWMKDEGYWAHYWPNVVSYRAGGQTYLFGQRKRYDAGHVTYRGPWFIQKINDSGSMGGENDSGEWEHYYATMNVFYHPASVRFYLLGHNTDKHFFIQHVTFDGKMGDETYSTDWGYYYDYLFPMAFDTSNLQLTNWMGNQNAVIGGRRLCEIAIPGSHDAGMNDADWGDCYPEGSAKKCNTVTQRGDIAFQLERGSRFFDLRPVLAHGSDGTDNWRTGHTTKHSGSLLGCKGEDKLSIVESLHDFFKVKSNAKEIVILKVSHCSMRYGGIAYDCTSDQLNAMAKNLAWHFDGQELVKCDPKDHCTLRNLTVNGILEKGNIILLMSGETVDGKNVQVDSKPADGIFTIDDDLYIFDSYSNSNDFETMRGDQLGKLRDMDNHIMGNIKLPYRIPFLLSWTLTLTTGNVISCDSEEKNGILAYSYKAQYRLYEEMQDQRQKGRLTKMKFPNILYVDDFDGAATRTAIYLNSLYDNLTDDVPVFSGTAAGRPEESRFFGLMSR